jgi:hypothetical protein
LLELLLLLYQVNVSEVSGPQLALKIFILGECILLRV